MNIDEIAVGVVGAGFGRYGLIPAFRRDRRCRIVALCTSTKASAERFASSLDIPHSFADYRLMFESVPMRAVAIAVPPRAQPAIARAALEAGIAVFAEKPLASDLASARDLLDCAANAAVSTAVDFMFPELATWSLAHELIREGQLGCIRHVMLDWRMESYDNARGGILWKTISEDGGGILSHFGSHCFYHLEWFFGPIGGLMADLSAAPDLASTGDTMAILGVQFERGVTASVSLCSAAPFGSGHRLEVYGDAGTLVLRNSTNDPVIGFELLYARRGDRTLMQIAHEEPDQQTTGEDHRVPPVARLVRRFMDSVSGGPAVRPSFADGVRTQELIEAARRSARDRVWVQVPSGTHAG